MLGLRVEATLHWGFWCRFPSTSKFQSSLPIFPPTTLIGALSADLIRKGSIKHDGKNVRGETWMVNGRISSPAAIFARVVTAATAYFKNDTVGYLYEDINKYVTLHFQTLTREKKRGGVRRRYLPEFRTGAIPTGKVIMPSGRVAICYLLDDGLLKESIGKNWREEIGMSALNMDRIGSKESIISVESIELTDTREIKDESIETRLYFPLRYADSENIDGNYYIERFWRGGWGRGEQLSFEEYIIPGKRAPLSSSRIRVRLREGRAYKFGPEEVLVA